LAVASVAHPEEISPNAIMQANLREQNLSVSYRYNMLLADTDDQQAQQSRADFLPNAQNILIAGGSFTTIVNLFVVVSVILVLTLWTDQYSAC
jgi:hypothetical protein